MLLPKGYDKDEVPADPSNPLAALLLPAAVVPGLMDETPLPPPPPSTEEIYFASSAIDDAIGYCGPIIYLKVSSIMIYFAYGLHH
jgi:hypothetical protein